TKEKPANKLLIFVSRFFVCRFAEGYGELVRRQNGVWVHWCVGGVGSVFRRIMGCGISLIRGFADMSSNT
ncbi:MAG: hypothetical protein MJ084_07530, partial [Saccharofermentans sp.]|nr:hypothetical protein [Saccharofermentans sp.]